MPDGQVASRRVVPAEIGYERDLYSTPGLPPELAQWLEVSIFSGVDDRAAKALATMVNGDANLSPQARCDWARFLMAFWYRAPEDLTAFKAAYETLIRARYPEDDWNGAELERYILSTLPSRIDNPRMGQVLVDMNWRMIDVSDSKHELLTSDQPIIRSNGLAPPGGHYAMAVSPSHLFMAAWPGPDLERFCRLDPSIIVSIANRMAAERSRRFVLERGTRQRSFVEKHLGKRQVATPLEGVLERYRRGDTA